MRAAAPATGATVAGRAIVGGLLKLIPGTGSVIGGAITSTTAAAVTTAFGEAYIRTLEVLFQRHQGNPPSADEVVATFKEQLRK